jgi:succinate dehydrogenase/fumarate reductase flavoprotein subunit
MPFLGGNSVKATSGINGALTKTQMRLGIQDSALKFEVKLAYLDLILN